MIPCPTPDFGSPPSRAPRSVQDARAAVGRARPHLAPEAPEHQAAVLLLCIGSVGMNVDRLARRTRFSRDFIARCLRRLADNGCWSEDGLVASWEDPASGPDFWRDVDVALGRCLRRMDDQGRPEWAPIGGWVKDFNYRRGAAADAILANEYYEIAPHDPEPVAGTAEEPEAEIAEAVDLAPPAQRGPVEPARPEPRWLGVSEEPAPEDAGEDEREGDGADEPASPDSPPMLVETWSGANWLG